MFILKCRLQYLRDIGASMSPFNAFLFQQGLQTLSLRMERHSQNALAVANWLEGRDEVEWVAYPGLKSSPWNKRAREVPAQRAGCDHRVRAEGRCRGRQELHRQPRALQSSRERRRRAQLGDPSCQHDPQPAHGGRADDDRRHARPRPPVGRNRDDRRHPRRPRRRASSREIVVVPMSAAGREPIPVTGAWRPGDPPGRRKFVMLFDDRPLLLRAGGSLSPITVAYETWGEPNRDASNAVLVCHTLTGDSHAAGPVEPGHAQLGWWNALIGPGTRDRHRPLPCRVPECPRWLPGVDRTVIARSRDAAAVRFALSRHHDSRPSRRGSGAGRGVGNRALERSDWGLDGRPARARMDRRNSRRESNGP